MTYFWRPVFPFSWQWEKKSNLVHTLLIQLLILYLIYTIYNYHFEEMVTYAAGIFNFFCLVLTFIVLYEVYFLIFCKGLERDSIDPTVPWLWKNSTPIHLLVQIELFIHVLRSLHIYTRLKVEKRKEKTEKDRREEKRELNSCEVTPKLISNCFKFRRKIKLNVRWMDWWMIEWMVDN